jgi:hypothetical protein
MATSRHANGGLSTADLERIRDTLSGGRRPKVMFTEAAGQIAGQTGQVVQLTDPEVSDEWLVVRFGHDELPFSPADLTFPPRHRSNGKSTSAPTPTTAKEDPMPTTASALPAESTAPSVTESKSAKQPSTTSANGGSPNGRPAGKATRGRAAKPKTPPALTVTLAYADGEWTVAAQQGNKVLAKPYLIKPAEALKLVGMIDVPGVQEAVEQVVATERAEAEQRAEQLRAQLAEVEAQLAELRQAG